MQDQRRIESLVSVNLTKGLQLLSELDLSNALDDFVNRDPSAISKLVERRMKETQALVDQEAAGDVESDDEMAEHIRKAVAESAARSAPTERAQVQQQGAAANGAPAGGTQAPAGTTAAAAAERDAVTRAMATTRANEDAMDDDMGTNGAEAREARAPRSAFDAPGSGAQRAGGTGTAGLSVPSRGGRAAEPAPSGTQATRAPGPSQTTGKSLAPRGRGPSTAASKPKPAAQKPCKPPAKGADSDSGDDVISLDDDSGDDSLSGDDVVPMSVPVSRARGRPPAPTRPTRAVAAAKATAKTRKKTPNETEDAFDFDGSDETDEDDDDDVVEDSDSGDGDDDDDEQVPIRTTGRGAKRKAPAAASAAGKKKPKATPKKKIPAPAKPPPGRTRKPQAIEIDDSGDDDESIPASAPASRRGRSTRAAR